MKAKQSPTTGLRFVSLILASFMPAIARGADAPLAEREWTVDGVARKALLHVPEAAAKSASPVVFAFHGHGGTMRNAAATFAYHKHWPEAIVVYMQGLPTPGMTDPEGKKPGWQKAAGDQGDRDLKFFDAVLASLTADYQVDRKRVFAAGHSNGGAFTYLLWTARGETFAAVAPAAAGTRDVAHLTPKPALCVAGESDELVPFALQARMMEAVRKVNGCDADGKEWAKSGTLVGTIYASKAGTPFVSVVYPGPHKFPPEAAALVAKFFKEVEVK